MPCRSFVRCPLRQSALWMVAMGLALAASVRAQEAPVDAKFLEGRRDVGAVQIPGSALFDEAKKQFRITASGAKSASCPAPAARRGA
jgi:hypothetical protein